MIAIAIDSRIISSEAFADFINDLGIRGRSNMAFIMDDSDGADR